MIRSSHIGCVDNKQRLFVCRQLVKSSIIRINMVDNDKMTWCAKKKENWPTNCIPWWSTFFFFVYEIFFFAFRILNFAINITHTGDKNHMIPDIILYIYTLNPVDYLYNDMIRKYQKKKHESSSNVISNWYFQPSYLLLFISEFFF